MAKVRVPVELRPPSRYGQWRHTYSGRFFRVNGIYRVPVKGDYYWSPWFGVSQAMFDFYVVDGGAFVLLERVK